jgi:hypothetical protein
VKALQVLHLLHLMQWTLHPVLHAALHLVLHLQHLQRQRLRRCSSYDTHAVADGAW